MPTGTALPGRIVKTFHRALTATFLLLTAGTASAQDVTIFAAASLREAVDAIVQQIETDEGIDVAVSYAGSSLLARQIESGAPADIFISANVEWMERLSQTGAVILNTRADLLANSLVLVETGEAPGDEADLSAERLRALVGGERIAMALVDAVPAGIYGAQAMRSLGVWDELAPQVAQSDNVRTALALVARGETRFGIVYKTDAAVAEVHIVGTFPAQSHTPIIYPIAIVDGADRAETRAVYDYLRSDAAWPVFQAAGFRHAPQP